MTRMVPVVVVVPEEAAALLDEWASNPDAKQAIAPLEPIMARAGWTPSMMIGGAALADAVAGHVRARGNSELGAVNALPAAVMALAGCLFALLIPGWPRVVAGAVFVGVGLAVVLAAVIAWASAWWSPTQGVRR